MESGHRYLQRAVPLVEEARLIHAELHGQYVLPGGVLRLSLPVDFAYAFLAPLLPQFAAQFPDIELEMDVTPRRVDLITEPFDLVVRAGELPDSGLIAHLLMHAPRQLYAAPDYLARCPAPQSPQDLAGHRCIGFRQLGGGRLYRWEFVRDGQAFEQAVSSALVLDDPELMLDAAIRGLGLAYALDVFCRAALTDGRLLPVLEGWLPRYDGFFLYYPNRQVSAALRALCEVLREG